MNLRVSLISDTNHPNVALQKISRWYRDRGYTVGLNLDNPDIVYISVLFSWNKQKMLNLKHELEDKGIQVNIGGSGYELSSKLEDRFAIQYPDYELYNNLDYDFGFITRGCIRSCKFCIVPITEGKIRYEGMYWITKPKVVLYDNNLLSHPEHLKILQELKDRKLKVCFNQGLDIRLLSIDNIKLLSQIKYYDLKFSKRRLYFAYDTDTADSEFFVRSGIKLLNDGGIKSQHLMFYVLYGFEDDPDLAFESLYKHYSILKDLGVKCYPMNFRKGDKTFSKCHKFTRYVIRGYERFMSFETYLRGIKK